MTRDTENLSLIVVMTDPTCCCVYFDLLFLVLVIVLFVVVVVVVVDFDYSMVDIVVFVERTRRRSRMWTSCVVVLVCGCCGTQE